MNIPIVVLPNAQQGMGSKVAIGPIVIYSWVWKDPGANSDPSPLVSSQVSQGKLPVSQIWPVLIIVLVGWYIPPLHTCAYLCRVRQSVA